MTEKPQILRQYTTEDVQAVIEAMPEDVEQRLHMSLMIFIEAAFSEGMPLAVVIRNVVNIYEAAEQQISEPQQ